MGVRSPMINPLELILELAKSGESFLAFLVICSTYYILKILIFYIPNRIVRSINIIVRGWPPPHLDADGDWKPEKEEDNETE